MKFITHELKGSIGYIKKQTVFEIVKTIILFLMALGIFFIGYFTLGTKKSLWSIFAVLALLPASKSLVSAIMFLRFKSLDEKTKDMLTDAIGNLPVLYENIITTREKTYFLPAIVYVKGNFSGYLEGNDDAVSKVNSHLDNVLLNGGYKNINVKIYNNADDFIQRCAELNEKFADAPMKNSENVFNTIRAVSL